MTDFTSLLAQNTATAGAPLTQETQPFFNLGDVLLSPVRGAEGAVNDFYGLLDTLSADILPDWDEGRLFGHAESTAGKVSTGLMQFAAGFMATGFGVGSAAKGAIQLGAKGWSYGNKVGKGLQAINSAHGGVKGIGAAAAKGAVTDFAFFDGHEARLSDAVAGTFLENDITRLLETDEEDTELEGRLKNTLEGLGLGALFDTILVGAKHVGIHKRLKAAQREKADIFLPEDTEGVVRGLERDRKHLQQAIAAKAELGEVDEVLQQALRDVTPDERGAVQFVTREGQEYRFTQAEAEAGLSQGAFEQFDDTLAKAGFGGVENVGRFVDKLTDLKGVDVEQLKTDPAAFRTFMDEAYGFDVPEDARLTNLANLDSDSLPAVIRAIESTFIGRLRAKGVSDKETANSVIKMLEEQFFDAAFTTDGEKFTAMQRLGSVTGLTKSADLAEEVTRRAALANYVFDKAARDFEIKLDDIGDPRQLTDDDLLDFVEALHNMGEIHKQVGRMNSSFGRGLRGVRHDVRGRIRQQADDALADPAAAERRALENEERILVAGADPLKRKASDMDKARANIINQIELARASLKSATNRVDKLKAMVDISKGASKDRGLGKLTEYWMGNLLMGPKTHVVNTVSNSVSLLLMPVESALGGITQFGMLRFGTGWKMMQQSFDQMSGITTAFLGLSKIHRDDNLWKAVWKSLKSGESTIMGGGGSGHELGQFARRKALTAQSMQESVVGGMSRVALGSEMGDAVAGAVGTGLGRAQRAPFHALAAMDELTKQLVTRADLQAQFARMAREQGVDNVGEFVAERMHLALTNGQAMSRRNLAQTAYDRLTAEGKTFGTQAERDAAIEARVQEILEDPKQRGVIQAVDGAIVKAEDRTFQTPLGRDSYLDKSGRAIDHFATQVPIVRLFAPFIRTPINLLKFAGRRTPLDPLAASYHAGVAAVRRISRGKLASHTHEATRILATGTDVEKAEVLGRWALGIGTFGAVTKLAYNHLENIDAGPDGDKHSVSIVGRGPSNPNEKKAWLAAGNQEYSIRIGDKSISFQRLDPLATVLGVAADLAQFSHFAEGDEAQDIGLALVFALSNNFTSKSYLQGIENLMTVLQGDQPVEVERILKSMAASFAPGGQAVAQATTSSFDGEMKEIRTYLDALYARYPGLSDKVEARRDVLGQEMERVGWAQKGGFAARWSPFPVTDAENADPVYVALANTRHNWSKPKVKARYSGVEVDLLEYQTEDGQTAYDRFQELTGTTLIGDETLHQKLARIIASDRYALLEEQARQRPVDDPIQDARVKLLGGVITQYRSRAKTLLYKEFKPIRSFVEETRQALTSPRPKGLFK